MHDLLEEIKLQRGQVVKVVCIQNGSAKAAIKGALKRKGARIIKIDGQLTIQGLGFEVPIIEGELPDLLPIVGDPLVHCIISKEEPGPDCGERVCATPRKAIYVIGGGFTADWIARKIGANKVVSQSI